MEKFSEGDVVICGTGQAGTVCQLGPNLWVLLTNGYIWCGSESMARYPQDQADLDAAPLNIDKP